MPPEVMRTMPGYGSDIAKNRAEARKIMEGLGYSARKPLKLKVSTRNIAIYRDPAVILIDQLKQIHIAASSRSSTRASGTRKSRAANSRSA
jgi:peptide/nickel transport system substrate-binding protein